MEKSYYEIMQDKFWALMDMVDGRNLTKMQEELRKYSRSEIVLLKMIFYTKVHKIADKYCFADTGIYAVREAITYGKEYYENLFEENNISLLDGLQGFESVAYVFDEVWELQCNTCTCVTECGDTCEMYGIGNSSRTACMGDSEYAYSQKFFNEELVVKKLSKEEGKKCYQFYLDECCREWFEPQCKGMDKFVKYMIEHHYVSEKHGSILKIFYESSAGRWYKELVFEKLGLRRTKYRNKYK